MSDYCRNEFTITVMTDVKIQLAYAATVNSQKSTDLNANKHAEFVC